MKAPKPEAPVYIVGLMRADSSILLATQGTDDEAWHAVPNALFERAERDLHTLVVPEYDKTTGRIVDWVPVPRCQTHLDDGWFCPTCTLVDEEYVRVNDSELTRDALALQNAVLKNTLAELRRAVYDLRVLRSSCSDSGDGDFRVHLSEREWDALLLLAKE